MMSSEESDGDDDEDEESTVFVVRMQVLFETTTYSESLIHAHVIAFAYCSCYCRFIMFDDLSCLST